MPEMKSRFRMKELSWSDLRLVGGGSFDQNQSGGGAETEGGHGEPPDGSDGGGGEG